MGSKILNVPYKSQNDPDANLKRTDCGSCCVAMILNGIGQPVTTNAVTAAANQQGDNGLMQSQVVSAAAAFGLSMAWQQGFSLDNLKNYINNGQPPIALVKYAYLPDRVDQASTGGHYVVVVGHDDSAQCVFINDPDYYPGTSGGYQKAYAYQTWISAWGGFAPGENANFCLIYPNQVGLIGGAERPPHRSTRGPAHRRCICHRREWRKFARTTQHQCCFAGGAVYGQHLVALGTESAPDAQAITWQQVKTDAGVIAFAAASQSGERYLSSSTPVAPYVVQVIDNQQIRDAGGLALRPSRDITQNPIDRAQAGERLTVFQRVVEADGTPWLWVQSPRNQYGWARETSQGQPLVIKVTTDLSGASGTGATPEPPRKVPPPTANTQDLYVIATDGVNLRKERSTTSQVLLIVPYGTKLTAIGPEVGPMRALSRGGKSAPPIINWAGGGEYQRRGHRVHQRARACAGDQRCAVGQVPSWAGHGQSAAVDVRPKPKLIGDAKLEGLQVLTL
jgi:hypothetical protein